MQSLPAFITNTRRPWQVPAANASLMEFAGLVAKRERINAEYDGDLDVKAIAIPALNVGASGVGRFTVERDAIFEWDETNWFLNTAGGGNNAGAVAISAQIIDGRTSRNFFSLQCPLQNFAGTGTFPHPLPVKRSFMPGSVVNVLFNNFDPAINYGTGQLALIGRKIFVGEIQNAESDELQYSKWEGTDGRYYAEDYYCYIAQLPPIVAGATAAVPFLIEQESDFEWITTSFAAFNPGQVSGGFNANQSPIVMQVTDGGMRSDLFNAALPLRAFCGDARVMGILPQSHIFDAQAQVTVTCTNNGVSTVTGLTVMFEGRKIFRLG